MIYAKVDVDIIDHPKLLEAGAEARDLWVWGLLYSQKHQTDGAIPTAALLRAPWGADGKGNVKVAEKLVLVGLWERTDKGWTVLRYSKKNQTKDEIAAKREAARERMANRRGSVRANIERTSSEPTTDVRQRTANAVPGVGSGVGVGSADPGEPEGGPPDSQARYAEAYAAGISRGKCAPWVWPGTKYAGWDLAKILKGFAIDAGKKPYRGDQLLRFIEHTAAEFASAVLASKTSQYYSAFEPKGCLKWLNEAALAEEARRVG